MIRWRCARLARSLKEAWPLWVGLLGFLLAHWLGWLLSENREELVRYAGTVLQVLGLFTVAIGLSQLRQLFGRPSLPARVAAWCWRVMAVFRKPKPASGGGSVRAGVSVVAAGCALRHVDPSAPVEERLSVLEENVRILTARIERNHQEAKQQSATLQAAVDREAQERATGDRRLTTQMEQVAIGGLYLETVGLVWLLLGVLEASIPHEIASTLTL